MLRSPLPFALLLLAAAPAQTPDHLVGLTRTLGNLHHLDHSTCNPLATCAPVGFPSAAGMPAYAGGTAWDPVHSGAWISNGQFLACVDDTCGYLCTPIVPPGLGNAVICGLEVVESRNELWLIDSNDILRVLSLTCPPTPVGNCPVAFLDPTYTTTGLAVDELSGKVFYSRVDAAFGTTVIAHASLTAPCVVLAGINIPMCGPVNGFTGLACDSASRRLYGTDGLRTMELPYTLAGAALVFGAPSCCVLGTPGADPMIGLAVRPGRATSNGTACANGACPNCAMGHTLNGSPVLGNAQFGYRLGGAPVGSLAWCLVGAGPCALPGTSVPALCGPIYASPVLGVLGVNLVTGAGACGGATDFAMPLPPAAGLAGFVLSSQCVVLCPSPASFGTSVSNCLSFELQGV